ncbi:nitrate reductase [Stagonosporopsis vannaccii]|nr:nitrate reductase [Stagonosporopsis vannaccii]
MPHQLPWQVRVTDHPGSTAEDIANEPDWEHLHGHDHRVGFRNKEGDRLPGITHRDDERASEAEKLAGEAKAEYEKLRERVKKGELLNFRDLIEGEKDLHLRHPENRSLGWRYVLEFTEDWVKNEEEWPANVKRRLEEKEKEQKKQQEQEKTGSKSNDSADSRDGKEKDHENQDEEQWKRDTGQDGKHHDAYADKGESDSGYSSENSDKQKSEYEKLRERYSPQEIALLRALQHEKDYITNLEQNDGKRESPQHNNRGTISIDEADQFSPDNWLPRSSDLIRLTGKHPLNAEADLTRLFEAGLITPNELHYVRNHGAVPRLLWEFHELNIENGKLTLSMDDLKNKFDAINIPIALACDGNRRKELNLIKKSKGFNWGAGGVSCAYWKGPLLRDVLLHAGVDPKLPEGKRSWINFEGADEPSEGKYATSIPLDYAMDSTNDVILAYEMNDTPLPPDHGYPVRLMIPGYVGGRCVKWLKRIWISEKENDSYYHIWDNRVLPSFVTEKDGAFAEALFNHPDTACNEQNLNSVIVKPAQGEKIPLTAAKKGQVYRIEGYAYDGGGHEVQRVEVSLDDGETWLYCIRKFPDAPIRHGKKFWTWLHWHVDVDFTHLLRAKSITVRCFNVFKNTQPQHGNWNVMGMMNNGWYIVKPFIVQDDDSETPSILYRHPVEPGTGDGGWMKPSTENQIATAKQEAGAPSKQFTREEIEKHNKENDCWIVVDNKVYDATSVLAWHPGGKAAVLSHAGKVHAETSSEFESIHDGYAYQKLKGMSPAQECILGTVTDKAAAFIKQSAEAAAKEKAKSSKGSDKITLQKHRWVPVKLLGRKSLSDDTRAYTFQLPDGKPDLGLGTCQHVQLGFHMKDRMLIRSYTPTKPLLPDSKAINNKNQELRDGNGTFELTVKTYFPTDEQPGGAMSNILDCMPIGEEIEIRGPTGEIEYHGNGSFTISGKEYKFTRINLVLGGSGITPGYALIARAMLSPDDRTEIRVVDANKSEKDILLKEALDGFEKESGGRLKITHVLSHPSDAWKGKTGHVNADIIKEALFEPRKNTGVFLCGPPAMIQKAALPALRDWGFKEDENIFGF